jgi:hypothetical protein
LERPEINNKKDPLLLTAVYTKYTVNTTPDGDSEVNRIMVAQFLNTLADVALNVASRRKEDEQSRKPDTD